MNTMCSVHRSSVADLPQCHLFIIELANADVRRNAYGEENASRIAVFSDYGKESQARETACESIEHEDDGTMGKTHGQQPMMNMVAIGFENVLGQHHPFFERRMRHSAAFETPEGTTDDGQQRIGDRQPEHEKRDDGREYRTSLL